MASLEFSDAGSLAVAFGLPEMFNVDELVSLVSVKRGQNDPQDVKLVQILLRFIYFEGTGGFSKPSQQRPNELLDDPNLEPDGRCGRTTDRWIKAFQVDRNSRRFLSSPSNSLKIDRIVNPAPLPTITSRSGQFFTIFALNLVCKRRDPFGYQKLLSLGVDALAAFLINNRLGE
jgi:hypothetical protein